MAKKGKDLKPHLGIFGRRNQGKSSFINALVGQETSIVSLQPGTTTDPVKKSVEIFGVGPTIVIDTAGIDDVGELGEKRKAKSLEMIEQIDLAILVISDNHFTDDERQLVRSFEEVDLPFFILHNKSDLAKLGEGVREKIATVTSAPVVEFSAETLENLESVVELIKSTMPETVFRQPSLLGGLIKPGNVVLLITPIDSEAPEGRMILPQVMTIRDVLDNDCIAIVLKETEIETFLEKTGIKPDLAITDSQAFELVNRLIPEETPLTGFSIVLARLRGDFENYLKGTHKIGSLKDGDRVLILESCTHQVSCDDIGRFKIPNWLKKQTGKQLEFDVTAGLNKLARPIHDYQLVIQCGGCVLTRRQVMNRLRPAIKAGVPVTNYGMAIAYLHGIYERAIAPFEGVSDGEYRN